MHLVANLQKKIKHEKSENKKKQFRKFNQQNSRDKIVFNTI
jgi:hypothetical protein